MTRRTGLVTAMHDAIEFEMDHDDRIVYMGTDAELGIWGYSRGLGAKFGPRRIRNTPISEYAVTGTGAGAAITGLRPIVDLCWANFMYAAWDQIADQIAKLPYMTNGQVSIPMVIIAGAGSCGNAGQHSDVPVAALVNLGAITVVFPSTPEDAAGLMTSALRSDDPVVFLYPGALMSEKGEPFVPGAEIPLGTARVRREGNDVTCWAYGQMAKRALRAAESVAEKGISVEIVDPRSLHPLDEAAVFESVAKTGRLVVVDEAHAASSLGRDIIARVACSAYDALTTPPILVAGADDVTIPYSPVLERELVPTVERIAAAFETAVGRASTAGVGHA